MGDSPELRLLLICGRLFLGTVEDEEALACLRSPLNLSHLLKKAADEGMDGLVASQLLRLARTYHLELSHSDPSTIPPLSPFVQALRGIFSRNGSMLAELSALRGTLRQRGLQAILLKGGALIQTVYRVHPGVRPLSDLDLLVKARDLPVFTELLLRQGFHPASPSSCFFTKGQAAIDLHTDLAGADRIRRRAQASRFNREAVWQEASPLDPQDPTLLVLSPLDQALHLVVHAFKHSFSRLIWFVDMGLALQLVNWEELIDRAETSGALGALAYSLFGLHALMGVKVPREVQARLPRFSRLARMFLQGVVSRQSPVGTLGEVMMAFSIPGLGSRLSYLMEFAFPRREVLAEVFPSTPSWLLYPRRGCQLVAQGFREGKNALRLIRNTNRQVPAFDQIRSAGPR